jgi:hypothetical protein
VATVRFRSKGKARSSRRGVWLSLILIAIALGLWFVPIASDQIERDYSSSVYLTMQRAITPASNAVPIALFDVMLGIATLALIARIVMRVRQVRQSPRGRPWRRTGRAVSWLALDVAAAAALLTLWFSLTWGGNYRRKPLLDFDRARVTREAALEMTRTTVRELNRLHPIAHSRPWPSLEALPATLGGAFADGQHAIGQPAPAIPGRPKSTVMQAWFRWAAIDGMTDPFFLEIVVNPDVLPSERPFVLAHEWAHVAGFADESEANFIAWLTCVRAARDAQYSGWLAAYQHVASGLPLPDRRVLAQALSPAVRADLEAERERFNRSSPAVRSAARGAYDTYLRANRIEEGIANYNAVVRLMLGTSLDADWNPRLR